MTRKRKSTPPAPAKPPFNPATALDHLDFDSLEEKIRGEEILIEGETRSQREARDIKKKLEKTEIDRRLEELRKKIK